MANEEQLKILKQGVNVWNKWRNENISDFGSLIDLRFADLREVNLEDADLSGVDLDSADFSGNSLVSIHLDGSNLCNAKFNNTYVGYADLTGTKCQKANFENSTISYTDFSKADLSEANLSHTTFHEVQFMLTTLNGANLEGADFFLADFQFAKFKQTILTKAVIRRSAFIENDLSEVIGLQETEFGLPSSISTDTLLLSKGKIPEAFLRGCGLRDWEIESAKLYNPDLTNDEIVKIQYRIYELRATQAFQINPLFISYSHADKPFVDKMDTALTKKGVRFWRDVHDATAGRLETQIDRAIRQNPTV